MSEGTVTLFGLVLHDLYALGTMLLPLIISFRYFLESVLLYFTVMN